MSSRILCNSFSRLFSRHHEWHSIQTSHLTFFRPVTNGNGSTYIGSKPSRAVLLTGLMLGGGTGLGVALYKKRLHKILSSGLILNNFMPSQLIMKRSLCAKAADPERDLPGWTPRTRELYEQYKAKLVTGEGWTELLTSVGRERNKTGFTLNHPEVGATFEYIMFFNEAEKKSVTILQFGEKIQGPPGYVHGGAIATVGDACAGVLVYTGLHIQCVTANLNVNYKKPLPINSTFIIETIVDKIEGRKYYVTSVFKSPDGSVVYDTVTTLFIDVSKHIKNK